MYILVNEGDGSMQIVDKAASPFAVHPTLQWYDIGANDYVVGGKYDKGAYTAPVPEPKRPNPVADKITARALIDALEAEGFISPAAADALRGRFP